ncbi:MAG TPA: FHA domain-containing protein [Clostridia bacterium]
MDDKIIISREELMENKVDVVLKRQHEEMALRTGMNSQVDTGKDKIGLIYKSWFNLMLAGLIGAFIAWLLIEPLIYNDDGNGIHSGSAYLLFSCVGGLVGLFIGCTEGILGRNILRTLKGGLVGMLIGAVGGIISTYFAEIVYRAIIHIGFSFFNKDSLNDLSHNFSALFVVIIARSLGWCIAGMTIGLGPGIALGSKKLTFNAFLGGMIGGALGGFLFDPINYVVSGGTLSSGDNVSRAIGLCVIGAAAGLMIGLVELVTMDAWFYMNDGPLKGKQFILYKNPTTIGSSAGCEIYLFKDPYISPRHAKISKIRDGYLLEDMDSTTGTLVNGVKITKHKLLSGDIIKIGESTLIYREKSKS